MHFAAKSIVGDSMRSPLDYFENNVTGSLNLINAALKGEVEHFRLFQHQSGLWRTRKHSHY